MLTIISYVNLSIVRTVQDERIECEAELLNGYEKLNMQRDFRRLTGRTQVLFVSVDNNIKEAE